MLNSIDEIGRQLDQAFVTKKELERSDFASFRFFASLCGMALWTGMTVLAVELYFGSDQYRYLTLAIALTVVAAYGVAGFWLFRSAFRRFGWLALGLRDELPGLVATFFLLATTLVFASGPIFDFGGLFRFLLAFGLLHLLWQLAQLPRRAAAYQRKIFATYSEAERDALARRFGFAPTESRS